MMNKIEKDINRIRVEIYEETKNLNQEQRNARLAKIVNSAEKEYGFKRIAKAKQNPIRRLYA